MIKLARLARARGIRRKTIKLRPIKAQLKEKRALQAIINDVVRTVFAHAPALIEAAARELPALQTMDGETIGIMKDALDDIDRLLELIVLQTQQVMVRIQGRVRGWANNLDQRHEEQFVNGVLTATKIDVSTLLDPHVAERTVGHYVTWSTSLIRDVGDEARKRLASAVIEAVRTRTEPRELAKTIQEIEPMSFRRAKNIAADQSNKLNNELDRARQRDAGIAKFEWIHSGNPHPREEHLDRDGEIFDLDDPDLAGDMPGDLPFCGCTGAAYIELDDGSTEDDTGDVPTDLVEE